MDNIKEIEQVVAHNLNTFKAYVQMKVGINHSFLDEQINDDGLAPETVLSHLIASHQEPGNNPARDLTAHIDYVIENTRPETLGEPIHQALTLGKIELARHLLERDKAVQLFNLNQRDFNGRTLLYLIIAAKNQQILRLLLSRLLNVNALSMDETNTFPIQPLHQAVQLDFAAGVRLLTANRAQINTVYGPLMETPVLLAARLGSINALEALLERPILELLIEAENKNTDNSAGYTAIEELCKRMQLDLNADDALRGVAMLLCRGAEPPREESMQSLLSSNRLALLKAVEEYLQDKPELVKSFVARCHVKDSALHSIVYADHSWGNSMRHLFGSPCEAAFMVEKLVMKTLTKNAASPSTTPIVSNSAAENLSELKDPIQLYAAFVTRYTEAYNNQKFPNPWSTMRWMIAEGVSDWETVEQYALSHPNSRTRIVYDEMFNLLPPKQLNVDDLAANQP